MKVTLKELSGTTWHLDIDENASVGELKEGIKREKGHEREHQKLIYQGKILNDDQATIKSCGLEEGKFIVVMISKIASHAFHPQPKEAAKPAEPVPPVAPATPQQSTASAQPPAAPAPQPRAQPAAVTETLAPAEPDPMTEALIQQLMEMGFPLDQCEPALRAAFGNPDRAVEYLMTGIPDNLREVASNPTPLRRAPSARSQEPAPVTPARANPPAASAAESGPLAFLANSPEFMQMRAIVQTTPQALGSLLTELGRQNPAILQAFSNNKDEFLRLLNDRSATRQMMTRGGGGPRGQAIQVTAEEKEAIDRLCALGFDRQLVIEAYLACDKNETLAANYLFDSSNFD